jgi:hypothetical protein
MLFLYSRKTQFIALLCWCVAVLAMFAVITGQHPFWLGSAASGFESDKTQAQLDTPLQRPATSTEPKPAPPQEAKPAPPSPARPEADPKLNRFLSLRASPGDDERIILNLDYVAAEKRGFTPGVVRSYYLEDTPAFVVDFGRPWVVLEEEIRIPLDMPRAREVQLWVSRASKHLRLLVALHSMRDASRASLRILPGGDNGLNMEITLPK